MPAPELFASDLVGITRAARELIITWNTGARDDQPKQPAAPFIALHAFLEASQL